MTGAQHLEAKLTSPEPPSFSFGFLWNPISPEARIVFMGSFLRRLRAQEGPGPIIVKSTRARHEILTIERQETGGVPSLVRAVPAVDSWSRFAKPGLPPW